MDEPTARRRRHARGANSVSVADLLAKSTPDEKASVSAIQARAAAEASGQVMPPPASMTVPMPVVPANPPPAPAARTTYRVGSGVPADPTDWGDEPDLYDEYDDQDGVTGVTSATDTDATPEFPGEDEDGPSSSTRLAKTILVTLVAMVATGVVTAVAAIGGEPPQRLTPAPPAVQPVAMTGPDVLRLNVVIERLQLGSPEENPNALPEPDPAGSTTGPAPGGSTQEAPATGETSQGLLVAPGAQPTSATGASTGAATVDRELAEGVVMDFYEALPRQKPHAYSLLSPAMQGDGQEAFEASWLRASDVNPNILPSDDGSIRASITVSRFTDPEVTRLVVRLDVLPIMVDGGQSLRIVGAQLLSAHRS